MKTKKLLSVVAVMMVFAMIFSGCSLIQKDEEKIAAKVVASVNGVDITNGELMEQVDAVVDYYEMYYVGEGYFDTDTGKETLESIKLDMLDSMVEEEVLAQKAASDNITVTEEEVDAKIQETKDLYGEESFDKMLADEGVDLNGYKELVKRDLSITKLKERDTADISATEEEAKTYYDEHPDTFKETPDTATASHILVSKENKDVADMVLDFALNGMGEFSELAQNYSTDGSASSGGSLGTFQKGQMVAPFNDAVFNEGNGIGVVDHLVESDYGYHIIKIEELNISDPLPFEEVKESALNYVKDEKTADVWDAKIDEYVAAASVTKNEKNL